MSNINEKYIKQTIDALADNRLDVTTVALGISKLPVREQIRFFKLAINYIEIMSEYGKQGYARLGLEDIARASVELMPIVDSWFPPAQGGQVTSEGVEYIALQTNVIGIVYNTAMEKETVIDYIRTKIDEAVDDMLGLTENSGEFNYFEGLIEAYNDVINYLQGEE